MQPVPLDRSNLAQTAVVVLATVVASVLLGFVTAYWTWAWFAPRAEARTQAAVRTGDRVETAYGLFGSVRRDQDGGAPTGIAIKLLGIVAAAGGRRGYAVVRLEPRQILAVPEGEDVVPGLRLAEVATDHVVLERSGNRETLAWPQKNAAK
jgi:general secretion pathway protein C